MSSQEHTPENDVSLDDIEIPIKRTTGDTLEERLTANAYHNILPARYLKKDEEGELVESQEDLFVRVGQNVALAEAVYELERQGDTLEVTPDQIKPNHHARGRLAGEVFGFDTDEFSEVGDLPKSLEDAREHLVHDSVELDEHNVNKFAYETLIEELPADIQSHVEDVAEVYTEMHEKLDFIANSPTLMNAGDDLQQLSACFVNSPEDDMDDIHETAKEAAKTFKCLTEDATVFEQTRGMISVADVDEGDSILQRTEDGVQYKPVEETHEYDDAETITLTLENGLTIQGTPNHELEINEEWTRLDNAEEGDSLSYSLGWIEQIDSRSPILATVEAGAQWANNRKVSNEEIMELYHQGLSDYEMAEELGVGKSTVQRRRNNELNLPPNGQGGRKQGSVSFDESEAHGLIKEGKTDSQVASALELSQATVQQFRTKNKIDANGTPVKEVTQPQYMSVNLAELVGLWAGDGSYHNDGIRFHIGRDEIVEWVEETVASLFDTTVSKSYSDGCYELCINSHEIKRWWKTNFDVKSNGAQNVTTPTVITQSTPAEMKGYLRGYFSADGSVNDGKYPVVYSSSETAIDQMATLLMGLDMPVKKSVIKDDESHPYYSVTVTTQHGRETFKSEIGFLDSREIIEVQSPRDITYDGNSHFEVKITDTTVDENSTVYDLTVTDNHQYITDGIVSHNSGGGMGYAFWNLRPTGDPVGSSGGVSSGPITFMNTFDQMCETVAQGGTRRGAQMGVMRVSHPDVIEFIHAKNKDVSLAHTLRLNDPDDYTHTKFIDALNEARELIDEDGKVPKHLRNAVEGHLSNFNISVGITDDFMEAVQNDEEFVFTNPRTNEPHIVTEQTAELYDMFGYGEYVEEGEVLSVPAREIWDDIIDGAHENGEPGVIYLERANKKHSFDVDEHPEHRILATNPCGEQPLEEYEACNLGHINFSTLVADNPEYQDYRAFVEAEGDQYDTTEETVEAFLEQALDWEEFNHRIEYGTRFLEDVVTMSDFPIDKIEEKVGNMRKIGLGIMGYAQILVQLGIQYGSDSANELARQMMTYMNHESKRVSHRIAVGDEPGMDRGVFAEWNKSKYASPTDYAEWFEHHTGEDAEEWGEDGYPLRNHNTTTIAPTGTTSMVGNTTGGCEPMFNVAYMKNVSDDVQGEDMLVEFDDYFLRVLEANNVDIEPVKDEAKELMQNNEFEGARDLETVPTEIAELFITTSEVTGLEHASVQCAFQDGVDSSISKTANFPNSATKEDMREVYEHIYENGGKGVTVYRDGTRSKQVLTTRADNAEFADEGEFTEFLTEQINEGTVTVEQVIDTLQEEFDVRATESADGQLGLSEYRKRPDALVGINQRINTGYGTLYVWISEDVNGNMFEVFASIGKAGGYTQSFTEALCRMISMALRYGVPPQRIVKHLSGIQSPKVAWENQEQVASVADGIAMAMDNYLEHNGVVGLITEMRTDDSDLADQLLGSEPPEDLDVEAQRQGVDEALEGEDADFEVGASVDLGGGPMENGQEPDEVDTSTQDLIAQGESPECPDCGLMSVYMSEGCKTCESCGWSEC